MLFQGPFLHPSSTLLACLIALVCIQFAGLSGLLVAIAFLAVAAYPAIPAWWRLLVRMRWLFASAWLIMAYGVPGDAWLDIAWMPTDQGVREASLHCGRLVFALGCLAWLFRRLDAGALMVALVGLLPAARRPGSSGERLAVRLWLVMELLQNERNVVKWEDMLQPESLPAAMPERLTVLLPEWRGADVALPAVTGCAGILLAWVG